MISNLFSFIFKKRRTNHHILEIGCGTGYNLDELQKWGKVFGIDINQQAVKLAQEKGFNVVIKNVNKDALPKNNFHSICLFDVLEHIENDRKLIQNIFNILNYNGYLFLTVPAYSFLFSSHDKAMNHVRRYNIKKLISILEENGFFIIKKGYWNSLLFFPIFINRMLKKILILINQKDKYKSEVKPLPRILNHIFYKILLFESNLINIVKLPWGLSIFIVAKKPNKAN